MISVGFKNGLYCNNRMSHLEMFLVKDFIKYRGRVMNYLNKMLNEMNYCK